MTQPTIYLLHGYNSTAESHWFPWLAAELKKEGYSFEFIQMPNPGEPNLTSWLATLEREIQDSHSPRIFIAHSLGCIALLQSLTTRHFEYPIVGMILVSGFLERLASTLGADFIQEGTGGHFLAEDGVLQLPIILQVIKDMSEKFGKVMK